MNSLDEIVSTFEKLGDWEQRYAFIIEMGENLPPMPNQLKVNHNKVKGCMSQVWISAYRSEENDGKIFYHGDCDTAVIKGVLAILIQLCNGKSVSDIQPLDVDEFFERLHLHEHLSPNRHVGVYAIVGLMKEQAFALLSSGGKEAAHDQSMTV